MKVVAFLPAKGTSERIKSKNLKILNGKPLFMYTLEKLCECEFIDEVYLDSESNDILDYAPYLQYIPLKREPELANNKTDGHQLFYNEVRQVEADIYIQILATSPFISKDTIKKGIEILKTHNEYDSVVLMKKDKEYLWKDGQPLYDKYHIPNSNMLPDTIIESMGLYIVRNDVAHKNKMRYGENVYMLFADAMETIDVNYPDEFILAESIMRGIQEKENLRFKVMANFFNSAIFSDILGDMGIDATIRGLTPNLPGKRIFGRANTLRIRAIQEDEDFRGIYDGLKTYEKLSPGEIIVVENEAIDRAYFGELNANLAIRSGAIGAILSSVTRDVEAVTKLDFPVFSNGYCCADVKRHAVIDYHQQPVTIQGIIIKPGDLIFADLCGVVRIPKKIEEKVLGLAIKSKAKENNVLKRVLDGENAESIYQNEGEF